VPPKQKGRKKTPAQVEKILGSKGMSDGRRMSGRVTSRKLVLVESRPKSKSNNYERKGCHMHACAATAGEVVRGNRPATFGSQLARDQDVMPTKSKSFQQTRPARTGYRPRPSADQSNQSCNRAQWFVFQVADHMLRSHIKPHGTGFARVRP
jgi:hypothetical protein